MKQVQTKYLLFNFLTRRKGPPVSVLAFYPQPSALHLAVGRQGKFKTAARALTTTPEQLVKQQIIPWLSGENLLHSIQFIVTSAYLPQIGESGLYRLTPPLPPVTMGIGPVLAGLTARELKVEAYLVDPTTPRECCPQALITGAPEFPRKCCGDGFIFKYLSRLEGGDRLIAAHLSETVQIGALSHGRLLDLSSSSHEGAFALQQTGGLPFDSVLDLCEKVGDRQKLLDKINLSGGFRGYLGDVGFSSSTAVEEEQIWQAFSYQVAKEIGACAAVLEGRFDAILLAGRLLKNGVFTAALKKRIGFLGTLAFYPEDQGLQALLAGAERIVAGEAILNY